MWLYLALFVRAHFVQMLRCLFNSSQIGWNNLSTIVHCHQCNGLCLSCVDVAANET